MPNCDIDLVLYLLNIQSLIAVKHPISELKPEQVFSGTSAL
jgi:hypothetical protein